MENSCVSSNTHIVYNIKWNESTSCVFATTIQSLIAYNKGVFRKKKEINSFSSSVQRCSFKDSLDLWFCFNKFVCCLFFSFICWRVMVLLQLLQLYYYHHYYNYCYYYLLYTFSSLFVWSTLFGCYIKMLCVWSFKCNAMQSIRIQVWYYACFSLYFAPSFIPNEIEFRCFFFFSICSCFIFFLKGSMSVYVWYIQFCNSIQHNVESHIHKKKRQIAIEY